MPKETTKENTYKTCDLNIAAILSTLGYEMSSAEMLENGKVYFEFKGDKDLTEKVNQIRTDSLEVRAYSLLLKYKQLKTVIKEIQAEKQRQNRAVSS